MAASHSVSSQQIEGTAAAPEAVSIRNCVAADLSIPELLRRDAQNIPAYFRLARQISNSDQAQIAQNATAGTISKSHHSEIIGGPP